MCGLFSFSLSLSLGVDAPSPFAAGNSTPVRGSVWPGPQSAAFRAAPELYSQRMLMDVLDTTLNSVRKKYILGPSPERVDMNIQMREPDVGFNLEENIQRKQDG